MNELKLSVDWLDICYIIASLFTLAFPILYSMSPWYATRMGRALMARGVGFSILMCINTFIRMFDLQDTIPGVRWIRLISITAISLTSGYMTWTLYDLNFRNKPLDRGDDFAYRHPEAERNRLRRYEPRAIEQGAAKYTTDDGTTPRK